MKVVICGFFLFCAQFAWSAGNQESTFAIKESGSYSGIYTLKIQDKNVFINGVKLPSKEVEKNFNEIAVLLENNGKEISCAGNEFIHQVKNEKGFKRERGCLNGGRFSELQKTFQKLERLTW